MASRDNNAFNTALSEEVQKRLTGAGLNEKILSGKLIDVTTDGSANTESSHAHGLGRTPTGYIVVGKDKAGVIYDGSSAWDATDIYIRSDTATVAAKLFVF